MLHAPKLFSLMPGYIALLAAGLLFGSCSPTAAQSEEEIFTLAPGDKIQVTVLQRPEFTGEFLIDQTGAVNMPIVGVIPVQDLSLAEAERQIAGRLVEGLLEAPIVSVNVREHRPVYVLGDVQTPGSHPYRYGASVLTAVASAGGLAVSRTDFLQADERMRILQSTHRRLVIRVARLEAQQTGASKIELPPNFPYSREDPSIAHIIEQEQKILSMQKSGHEQAVQLLRAQRPRIEAEIAGIKSQSDAEAEQLRLLQEHIADYSKLVANGLTRRYAMIELQREEARHKGSLARFASDLARLDNSIGELGVRVQTLQNEYMQRIITELQDNRIRLQEIEMSIPTAQELREASLQVSPTELGVSAQGPYAISIFRVSKNGERSFEAGWATAIMPGDVIEVRRVGPDHVPSKRSPAPAGASTRPQKTTDASKIIH